MRNITKTASSAPLLLAITLSLTACGEHSFEEVLGGLLESSNSKASGEDSSSSAGGSNNPDTNNCTFTDARDGKIYKCVNIGTQTWMAENLNYNASGSKCYDNDPSNCATYGRLYNWPTAMTACPSGWHLPSSADWNKLLKFVDNATGGNGEDDFCRAVGTGICYESHTAGMYLKATSGWGYGSGVWKATSGWDSYSSGNGNGTDDFGFAALPGGIGYTDCCPYFTGLGSFGNWWSALSWTEAYDGAHYLDMIAGLKEVNVNTDFQVNLMSVRCVKN